MNSRQDLLNVMDSVSTGAGACCVVVVGVDRFARLRGAIGYDLAERLIEELASRIRSVTGESCVARLAPDALGVCLTGPTAIVSVVPLVQAGLPQSMVLAGHRVDAPIRIGYAQGGDAHSGENLLQKAEIALDQARENGRSAQEFSAEEYGDPLGRLTLLDELGVALQHDEMQLYYQPQVAMRTGDVVSAEALIRWESSTRGLVPPGHFIPAAEETGLIRDLTEWAVARAIRDVGILKDAGYELRIGVNISSRLLCDPAFVGNAESLVRGNADGLTFEITESVAITDWSMALQNLKVFSSLGVRIAIDDYGSGAATLAYIQQLPAQELKIDRLFVTGITESHRDPLLVRSTIELGHALELEVVAEGIQDADALALLTMMGCDIAQGYYIGMPMPLDEFLTYLREDTARERVGAPVSSAMLWASES